MRLSPAPSRSASTACRPKRLQWVFLPRMYALLDAEAPLPTRFAITPYFEEALKDREPSSLPLLVLLQQLDLMLNKEP